jgi:hypothetical protein
MHTNDNNAKIRTSAREQPPCARSHPLDSNRHQRFVARPHPPPHTHTHTRRAKWSPSRSSSATVATLPSLLEGPRSLARPPADGDGSWVPGAAAGGGMHSHNRGGQPGT